MQGLRQGLLAKRFKQHWQATGPGLVNFSIDAHQYQAQRRLPLQQALGQLAAVHAARHDDVAKHNRNISDLLNHITEQEMRVTKIASVGIGFLAMGLGILFKDQNVAFLVALTFGVAASANFPILILSMYWQGLTTRGALWGGIAGLASAVGLVILSPAVWVKVLGNAKPIFPYDHPAIISMTSAFVVTWLMSVTDKSAGGAKEAEAFEEQYIRAQTGLGAAAASAH